MKIQASINDREGYKDILKILKPLQPFDTLRDREMDVLAELIYWYNYYGDMPEDVKQTMVFDYKTRIEIMTKLNIPIEVLNNNISWLRKRGFIAGKTLKFKLPKLVADESTQLTFDLKIKTYVPEDMVNDNK